MLRLDGRVPLPERPRKGLIERLADALGHLIDVHLAVNNRDCWIRVAFYFWSGKPR